MSNKEYKLKIIDAGVYPTAEMIKIVKEKHAGMVTKAMILSAFKEVSARETAPSQSAETKNAPGKDDPATVDITPAPSLPKGTKNAADGKHTH
jgi:hypothetical protein